MKRIAIKLLFIGIFLITNILTAAEIKWQITGTVVEDGTEETIPYATIALYNKSDSMLVTGTMSNDDGAFILEKIAQGDYFLKVSFMGYTDYTIDSITLNENQEVLNIGDIYLKPNVEALTEISIVAKNKAIKSSVDKQVLTVSSNLMATGGTAVDALKLSPSIQTDSEGNVKLRGSSNFIVLINGRPTTLSPDEVLKQTPANNISKIEVITNPSVKYNAEGGAGIINIILKKSVTSGFNGIVNAMIGSRNKYSSDANFNLNKEKVSYSIGFDWRDYTTTAENDYYRTLQMVDTVSYATMFQDREITQGNLGFRFGLDFNPNEDNNFTYSFHTGNTITEADILANTSGKTVPASTEIYSKNSFYYNAKPTFFTNNLGYTKTLNDKGSNIAFNTFYSYIDYKTYNDQVLANANSEYNSIDPEPYLQNIENNNNSHDLRIDVDYTNMFSDNKSLETGLSYHLYNRFLNVTYSTYDYNTNTWVDNTDYTDKYNFDETVYAAYANYNSSFWGLQTSFGLRLEYMDRLLIQQGTGKSYEYEKLNVFPGLSVLKSFNDNNSLKLALTNRINRPDEYMMNPFPEFEDNYFLNVGNPYLIPETVRNLELGYTFTKDNNMFSSNLYYRQTTDKLEQKLTINEDDKILVMFHNDAEDKTLGLELMGNIDITDWWTINANANLFDYYISANIEGIKTSRSAFSWSTQLVNSFNITETTSIQIIGSYNSRTVRSQGELSDYYFVDAALKQQFLNGRISISLQLKDMFQSLNYQLITETENMDLLGDFQNESPIFLFNVSYKFSNYKKNTKDVHTEFDM
jgi:outer membrane receptor protein involved in Fe transport